MYQVNTYAWDFALLAALSAPRPLLLSNSDKDTIFPLDGVYRVHQQLKRIYKLYGAEEKLGLLITEGPHSDTQDLQVPSFRWMNRWLKKDDSQVEQAVKRFAPEELKVFSSLPADQINTRIHDTFVPVCEIPRPPSSEMEWQTQATSWKALLRQKVLGNLPEPTGLVPIKTLTAATRNRVQTRVFEFRPDEVYRLPIVVLTAGRMRPKRLVVRVMDQGDLPRWAAIGRAHFPGILSSSPAGNERGVGEQELLGQLSGNVALALVFPRGIGPTAWPDKKDVQIRRRFLLLGQSLEAMQVWDTRMALSALRSIPDLKDTIIALQGARTMGVVALLAAGVEPTVESLELEELPGSLANGPALPNALRYFDVPQLLALVLPRKIQISDSTPTTWEWTSRIVSVAGGELRFR
jgi:hypothetical protein